MTSLSKRIRLAALMACWGVTLACGSTVDTSGCPAASITLPIVVVGDTFGRGSIALERDAEGQLQLKIVLFQADSEQPMLQLHAPATCDAGILRARFGAGDSQSSPARVLGGSFEGIYQPRLLQKDVFGAWQVTIVDKKTNEEHSLRGYLEHANESSNDAAKVSTRVRTD